MGQIITMNAFDHRLPEAFGDRCIAAQAKGDGQRIGELLAVLRTFTKDFPYDIQLGPGLYPRIECQVSGYGHFPEAWPAWVMEFQGQGISESGELPKHGLRCRYRSGAKVMIDLDTGEVVVDSGMARIWGPMERIR